jgi:Archaeal/vacuolar-type H+-ATPase subunit E
MGLDAVVEEIRGKGQKEADTIRAETQGVVNRILTEAQAKAEKIKMTANEDVEKQISHILSQEISAANLVVKRESLNAQKDLLDKVYQSALETIVNLPESFHQEAIRNLLKEAGSQIPDGIVHCNERDMPALTRILSGDSGFRGFKPGKMIKIEGGIIVESSDGELQIDNSYRTFLDSVWESGLKDASDLLFG